ncbi:response regulator transcription factor [Sphingomonas sp. DC1600-2]
MDRLVHIVDDDAIVRRSTALFLRTQGFIPKTYDSGRAFLEVAPMLGPGCVLLDVLMPGLDGIAVLERLQSIEFGCPIVVMTVLRDTTTAVAAMRRGAYNYIEKPFDHTTILPALEEAFSAIARLESQRLTAAQASARIDTLTGRERDILEGLATGQTNKMIAITLGISPRTVEIHRANMMEKLRVTTLPEVLRIALLAGIGTEV